MFVVFSEQRPESCQLTPESGDVQSSNKRSSTLRLGIMKGASSADTSSSSRFIRACIHRMAHAVAANRLYLGDMERSSARARCNDQARWL